MKSIVRTKIITTTTRETASSKKKGKWGTAIASSLFGVGLGMEQDKWHSRHAETEEVYTFLVIYSDGDKETIEAVKDDEMYKKLIMYAD